MAGLGFDAAMMRGAPERLKNRVGWLAYAVSGAKNLRGPRAKARLSADGGPDVTRRIQTVVIGNCGTLTGGIQLLPDARWTTGGWTPRCCLPRGSRAGRRWPRAC